MTDTVNAMNRDAYNEIDLLYTMSNKLVYAEAPAQQLDAVSDYARQCGATQGVLFYIENPEHNPTTWVLTVAEWVTHEPHRLGVGTRFENIRYDYVKYLLQYPVRPALVEDITANPGISDALRQHMIDHEVRGAAILPINSSGRWIGILWFTWDKPHRFNLQDQRIYRALQRSIAPVIDARRLLEQMQRRTAELEQANQEINLLYHTSEIINAANTYEDVVEAVARFDPDADVVTLMLWENLDWHSARYIELLVVIDRNGDAKLKKGDRLPKEHFPIARKMLGQRVWLFEDTQNHPMVDEVTRQNWKDIEILSFVGPSLYVNQRWLGGITFHSKRPRSYTGRQVRLFAGIGDLVLAAVERIRLQRETELATQTFAVLEERNRLARELHDSVSQALYGIALTVKTARVLIDRAPEQAAEPLDYMLSLSQAALSEMRALIFELRPETLEKEGLVEALTRQAEMLQLRYGVKVDAALGDEPAVSLDIKENLYWIAREALHNVVKHARAASVTMRLTCSSETITLHVEDDGIGFDTSQPLRGHLGLRSMSERAARINGALEIFSQPRRGTRLEVTAPCR